MLATTTRVQLTWVLIFTFVTLIILPGMTSAFGSHIDTHVEGVLYLTDSAVTTDGQTYLYQVTLNDSDSRADLTLLESLPFDQVDAMAIEPNGSVIYVIDKFTSKLGAYIVASDTFVDTGTVVVDSGSGAPIFDIVLAAFSAEGDLFVASQATNNIYRVDLATGNALSLGPVMRGTVEVDIHGADLVFANDGTMYLWTNVPKSGAPLGLYEIEDPYALPITATYKGQGDADFFTGLAARGNGEGDLVGSETTGDNVKVIRRNDAAMPIDYPMYKDGVPYQYTFGDMTSVLIDDCSCKCACKPSGWKGFFCREQNHHFSDDFAGHAAKIDEQDIKSDTRNSDADEDEPHPPAAAIVDTPSTQQDAASQQIPPDTDLIPDDGEEMMIDEVTLPEIPNLEGIDPIVRELRERPVRAVRGL